MTTHPLTTIKASEAKTSAASATAHCCISGIPLLKIEALAAGAWPLLRSFEGQLIHPIYELQTESLLRRYLNQLLEAQNNSFTLSENALLQLQLTMSATLHKMGCLAINYKEEGTLPSHAVVVGSAEPLFRIAQWHLRLVKKTPLPRYRPVIGWPNFRAWTETSTAIFNSWNNAKSKERRALEDLDDLFATETPIEKVYARLDPKKVWGWIANQIQLHTSPGRLTTMRTLFTTNDLDPLEWLQDDVDDLIELIANYCDPNHEVMHYVMQRCNSIRRQLRDYQQGFTLLTGDVASSFIDVDDKEQAKKESETTNASLSSFRTLASTLTTLPAAPQRSAYPKLIDFLKAQAEHRIIVKIFQEQSSQSAATKQG